MKKITVRWEDHHSESDWYNPKHEKPLRPMIVETRGYWTREDEHILEVARDYIKESEEYGDCIRILKKCIIYRSDK